MVDAILGVLVEKLLTVIENEAHHILEYPEQFKKTKEELLFMQSFLKDMEKVNVKDRKEVLKRVMQKLRELVYNAEDIIADCELLFTQRERRQVPNCVFNFSPNILKFRYRMGKKLGKINQDIGHLKEDMKSFLEPALILSNQDVSRSHPVKYPVLVNEAEIVGLDDDTRKIKGWVFEAKGHLSIIGIVGMGGIGKTTLAQKIYDNENVKKHFAWTFFVIVSQSFELEEIIKNILRKLNVNEDSLKIDTYGLLEKLHRQMNGMKYMLILDDVWGTNEGVGSWWTSLTSALSQGSDGSCVIVTTRHEEVAQSMGAIESRIHYPQILSNDDSWSLFSKYAFADEEGRCPNQNLESIGKEIVSQCGGLPLAIKVMGGMMSRKGHSLFEWKRISKVLKEKLAFPENDEKVIHVLQLSFEDLPMHLKPCILSISMFPEDYMMFIDDIIYWWIDEGFVQERDGRTSYELGEEYIDELRSRSLLLGARKNVFKTKFDYYRVHDMIRDMLIKIAREENFIGLDDRGRLSFSTQSRRAGIMHYTNLNDFDKINSKLLRTLVLRGQKENKQFIENVGIKLCQLQRLRVLDIAFLSSAEPEDWLSGIGSLRHLIHLKIQHSALVTLPNSIGKLCNLKTLRIISCQCLKKLPAQVKSLVKLTTLEIVDCHLLTCFPVEVGSLSNIEELSEFEPAKDGFCIMDLKKLMKLRKLGIRLNSKLQIEEGALHVLSELKQLKILNIRCNPREDLTRELDYELFPLQQLEVLYLFAYSGTTTPAWLNPTTLPNLLFLCIFGGKITSLNSGFFGKRNENEIWKLEAIVLEDLEELMKEEGPSIKEKIPTLRMLDEYNW